jgi:hypothetical protein
MFLQFQTNNVLKTEISLFSRPNTKEEKDTKKLMKGCEAKKICKQLITTRISNETKKETNSTSKFTAVFNIEPRNFCFNGLFEFH